MKLASGSYSQQRAIFPLESTVFEHPCDGHTVLLRLADSTTCHKVLRAAHGVVQKCSNSAGGSGPRKSEKEPGGEKPMLIPFGLRLDVSAFCTQHPNHQHIAATHAHTQ